MPEPLVLYARRDDTPATAILTLNRPEARNALSFALVDAIAEGFVRAREDGDVRVVVLTGAGPAFCAGVDLKEMATLGARPERRGWNRPSYAQAMEDFGGPIIGAINGPAVTGGLELALACDVLVASTSARFADTHVRVGVVPGGGASQLLARAIGPYRAKYLSLTGNYLDATQAAEWGLVSHVVEPEALLDTACRVAADMASTPPEMLVAIKKLMDDGIALPLGEALALEQQRSSDHLAQAERWTAAGAAFDSVRDRGRAQKGPRE